MLSYNESLHRAIVTGGWEFEENFTGSRDGRVAAEDSLADGLRILREMQDKARAQSRAQAQDHAYRAAVSRRVRQLEAEADVKRVRAEADRNIAARRAAAERGEGFGNDGIWMARKVEGGRVGEVRQSYPSYSHVGVVAGSVGQVGHVGHVGQVSQTSSQGSQGSQVRPRSEVVAEKEFFPIRKRDSKLKKALKMLW